ncbi:MULTISPECIES: hypothetical protein [unclassified Mucilaginibacter]|uniref:hypothetical protein n=1 Tax=unclassified Mucilaginibacter TaxID=2617802 RepID=UPI00095A5134|nr:MULTISPECIES: hypothetical protein [unclassified Mucilaginibacter]OJW16875.1 MAG: hypothetical protein BGO48_10490 [Mucilaginibacter sp. 44-25]PLW91553.1 MAG: hypothetical protein C0154_00605 [Mucilaginibacter sp.]HEK21858.1 hypothetical protein [Bacteroidota bacterium]
MNTKIKIALLSFVFAVSTYAAFANTASQTATCDASNSNPCKIDGVGSGTGKLISNPGSN